jgi:hypothetical protein
MLVSKAWQLARKQVPVDIGSVQKPIVEAYEAIVGREIKDHFGYYLLNLGRFNDRTNVEVVCLFKN